MKETRATVKRALWTVLLVVPAVSLAFAEEGPAQGGKLVSAFYPARLVARARANAAAHRWAAGVRDSIVASARPWMELADEQLWDLMFSNTIKRSWMVWSNGHCPSCREGVPMYNWEIDAFARPWKVRCPHCEEIFPKNDFHRYYRSGLNERGVFEPGRADRSLLYNEEHPESEDPLRAFGVDDGDGYTEGSKRWRFIGAYLVYGLWKQAIVGGARSLGAAYVVTGDKAYAHKAGVLLDRVADLYPSFDFRREGILYEGPGSRGYVSTWHDACVEARDLAMAYDQVFEAISRGEALVTFLKHAGQRARPQRSRAFSFDLSAFLQRQMHNEPRTSSGDSIFGDASATALDRVFDDGEPQSAVPRSAAHLWLEHSLLHVVGNPRAVIRNLDTSDRFGPRTRRQSHADRDVGCRSFGVPENLVGVSD